VTKSYSSAEGEQHVLRGVDLHVSPGEVVAIVGPSGSGKTTLLGICGLLQRPTSGRVIVDGAPATDLDEAERTRVRAASIGFLFQEATLSAHLTAAENVLLPLLADRRSAPASVAQALLERMGLAQHAHKLPSALSGGQAQRVALCRALVRSPRVILADEPTASLDSASADNVRAQLRAVAGDGVAVVVATHDPLTVAFADRAVAIHDGRLVASAPPAAPRTLAVPAGPRAVVVEES
jgi:ABC-type lipoprotein export system ATPase subunit